MSRSRTLGPLGLAALLALGVLGVLRLRMGGASALELPSGARAAAEEASAPSAAPSEREANRSAIEAEELANAKSAVDPSHAACLTVELVAAGRPASGGEVELQCGTEKNPWDREVDPKTGCARFENLAPGTYLVSLPKTPPGFLPPRAFKRRSGPDEEARSATLAAEDRSVRFELEPAVRVFGDVRTSSGQLARSIRSPGGCSIRLRCYRKSASWSESVEEQYFDIVEGHYEADLYEGVWVLSIEGMPLAGDGGKAEEACAAPAPALRLLPPASITQIDFDFRPLGSARLHGRILDEEGQAFVGLRGGIGETSTLVDPTSRETMARTWAGAGDGASFHTDHEGRFELPNLTPGRYMLFVEPEGFNPEAPPGGSKLGELPPTRTLGLAGGDNTIELTIRRPHPAHITGTVTVDAEWARIHATKEFLPEIEIVYATGRDDIPVARRNIPYVRARPEFEFWFEASTAEPRLEFTLAGEKLVQPLSLSTAGDPAPLAIHFPH